DQRRTGDAEGEVRRREVLGRVDGPDALAILRLPAGEEAGNAESVELAFMDCRRRARSDAELADELLVQRAAVVLLGPDFFAVVGIVGGNFLDVLALNLGVEEDLALGNDGRAVSFADRLAPEDLGRL